MNRTTSGKKPTLRSVDGIWVRNVVPQRTSTDVMNTRKNTFGTDIFLAAISVVPAAVVWIFADQLYTGIALGITIFLAAEYGYPAYKTGRINVEPALRFISHARESIRSRVTSRA